VRKNTALFLILFISVSLSGQVDTAKLRNDSIPDRIYLLQKVKRNGETLPEIEIKEVAVVGRMKGSPRFIT
jgi:hypothetical protein